MQESTVQEKRCDVCFRVQPEVFEIYEDGKRIGMCQECGSHNASRRETLSNMCFVTHWLPWSGVCSDYLRRATVFVNGKYVSWKEFSETDPDLVMLQIATSLRYLTVCSVWYAGREAARKDQYYGVGVS